MNFQWIKDRLINGLLYVGAALLAGFLLYSAFLKPTTTQNTKVESGGEVNHYFESAKVSSIFSCRNLDAEAYMKALKK